MAAEESSQGAALGPDFLKHTRGAPPAKPEVLHLGDVLGEFMEALCIIDVVSRTLTDLSSDASEGVGSCALVLRRGYQMFDTAYRRFDSCLADGNGSGGDGDNGLDNDPADELHGEGGRPNRERGRVKKGTKRKVRRMRK